MFLLVCFQGILPERGIEGKMQTSNLLFFVWTDFADV